MPGFTSTFPAGFQSQALDPMVCFCQLLCFCIKWKVFSSKKAGPYLPLYCGATFSEVYHGIRGLSLPRVSSCVSLLHFARPHRPGPVLPVPMCPHTSALEKPQLFH